MYFFSFAVGYVTTFTHRSPNGHHVKKGQVLFSLTEHYVMSLIVQHGSLDKAVTAFPVVSLKLIGESCVLIYDYP